MSDQASLPTPKGAAEAAVPEHQPSVGQLIATAQKELSLLVRQEIALAKSEITLNVKIGGLGIALLVAAAFVGLLAVILLSFFLVYLVNLTGLGLVWSYLIIVVLYLAVAGLLGFVGYKKLTKVRPPERAIHQAQETKNTLLRKG